MTRTLDLAVIPGDGIGPEVVSQALRVIMASLENTDVDVATTEYNLGAEHWLETGETLTTETLEQLREHQAILFGAVGAAPNDERIPSGILEREILLKLRFAFDHAVNLRPSRLFPGSVSPLSEPGQIDFVVVREGTEGLYAGNGGQFKTGTEHEIATEVSINTAHGVRRVVRDAFQRANARRKKLTLVHKHNVLVNAGKLWNRIVNEEATNYPDVIVDYLHVDAATIFMVTDPARFDVIVTDNLFGDILTDLAGAVTGGIGLASSGNINVDGTAPSMFEPVHGSAPDIAGKNIADPTAAILSGALLLRHVGLCEQADAIEAAVERDLAALVDAPAAPQRATTEIGDAIIAQLSA
ncbi:3-isopropylmalate dehydrogenase [Pseudoglutamicibacter albus]|uniref:3-isopropylmalate dehydrogenase n=1 Tax=Pseudoglutamicibacter albus TaxID=98671 RepID=UPI001EF5F0A2|nr:3-isopropylmalate dehydrogenase [Pseudoglutamicibacter albus]MCG7304877.1 3-isopropylmalate dehydrogenase [Pseudoglutamicibacter albus]